MTEYSQTYLDAMQRQKHNGCFVCGRNTSHGLNLHFTVQPDGRVTAEFTPAKLWQGYPNLLHGGIVSTLLDDAMAGSLFARNVSAVTTRLEVQFRKPVITETPSRVTAWVDRIDNRLFNCRAELYQHEVRCARATGLFLATDRY